MTIAPGLSPPYIVAMDSSASSAASDALAYGADAISSYATDDTDLVGGGPYSQLISKDQSNWDSWKATGWKVVPWATSGWDPRPRIENPITCAHYCPTC